MSGRSGTGREIRVMILGGMDHPGGRRPESRGTSIGDEAGRGSPPLSDATVVSADSLLQILADVFRCDAAALTSEAAIHEVRSWDSLTHLELIVRLEETFRIEFSQDEIVFMTSVARIAETLVRRGVFGEWRRAETT